MEEIIWELTLLEVYQSNKKEQLLTLITQALSELSYQRFLSNLSNYQIYKNQLLQLIKNDIDYDLLHNYPITLIQIFEEYEKICSKHTSRLMFPNQMVCVYSYIRIIKATKKIRCHFDGSTISENELYLSYRPLLDNLDTKERFVLEHTIKVNPIYENILPNNIQELEFLYEHYQNTDLPDQFDIYFDEFRSGYTFSLLKLKKKR